MLQKKNDKITENIIANDYMEKVPSSITIENTTSIADNIPTTLNFTVHQTDNDVRSDAFIKVYDDEDNLNYGTNMVIQSHGNMFVGAGDSVDNIYKNTTSKTGERLYLTADSDIHFYTGVANDASSYKTPLILYNNGTSSLYPVGSVYITSTNSNPASYLGGTWSLIDKGFKLTEPYNAGTNVFTLNTTNTTSLTSCWVSRYDHMLQIEIVWVNKVVGNDNTISWGNFNMAALGTTGTFGVTVRHDGFSDGGNGFLQIALSNTGELVSYDVVTKAANGTIAAGNTLYFTALLPIRMSSMLDSFCDKFYWKRTA